MEPVALFFITAGKGGICRQQTCGWNGWSMMKPSHQRAGMSRIRDMIGITLRSWDYNGIQPTASNTMRWVHVSRGSLMRWTIPLSGMTCPQRPDDRSGHFSFSSGQPQANSGKPIELESGAFCHCLPGIHQASTMYFFRNFLIHGGSQLSSSYQ